MGFLSTIVKLIREFFIKIASKFFNAIRDPDSGKIKFLSNPNDLKKFFMVIGIVLSVFFVLYILFRGDVSRIDGVANLQKEMENKTGINAPEQEDLQGNFVDPLAQLKGLNGEETSNRGKVEILPYEECSLLIDRFKSGGELSSDEKIKLQECVDKNVLQLDANELANLKKLMQEGLSDSEKQLLKDLFKNEPKCQEEFDRQLKSSESKDFISNLIMNDELNVMLQDILKNKELIDKLLTNEGFAKDKLNLTSQESIFLKRLLENCSPELLTKMLSDPKYRELFKKLLDSAMKVSDALNSSSFPPEEKEIVRAFLNNELGTDTPEEAIAEALLGLDPMKKQLAKDLLNARKIGDEPLSTALTKKIKGEELTPVEQNILDRLDSAKLAEAARNTDSALSDIYKKMAKGIPLSSDEKKILEAKNKFGENVVRGDGIDKEEMLRQLAKDLAEKQSSLDDLRGQLPKAQLDSSDAAKKIQTGQVLSPDEIAALQRFSDLQKQIQDLEKELEERRNELAQIYSGLQSTLDQIAISLQRVGNGQITSDFEFIKCSDVKPLKLVKTIRKKPIKSVTEYFDADGKPLTPAQITLYEALRKKKDLLAKTENDLLNPSNVNTSSLNEIAGRTQKSSDVDSLFFYKGQNLKAFQLSPERPIGGVLLSEILVSDKGGGQVVRVKIIHDVYDSITNKLVMPKGTIAQGKTGGFDADTGLMNITLDKVFVGGKPITVSFNLASSDMREGLSGEVRDTRGKLLAGTFISAFSSGALSALSQNFIQPLQDSQILSEALTGAGLSGAAEVAAKIAEMYAGDLQNAAKIFYVPANIPVILFPLD